MSKNIEFNSIDGYMTEVQRFIPYSEDKIQEALKELQIDVEAAMGEGKSPSAEFGSPRDVALNLTESHPDWYAKRASWWTRLAAFLIDLFIETVLLVIYLGGGFFLIIAFVMPYDELVQEFNRWGSETFNMIELLTPTNILLIAIISFLTITTMLIILGYNIALEYYLGATIGKKLFNLLVVDQVGVRITWKQAIIRNFSKILISEELLPFDVVLGMILQKMNPEKTKNQRGLDILAETIVIKQ